MRTTFIGTLLSLYAYADHTTNQDLPTWEFCMDFSSCHQMLDVMAYNPFTFASLDGLVNFLDYNWDWGLNEAELKGAFDKYD